MKHIDDLKETKSLAPLLYSRCGNFQIRDPSLEGVAFERELAGTSVSGANSSVRPSRCSRASPLLARRAPCLKGIEAHALSCGFRGRPVKRSDNGGIES